MNYDERELIARAALTAKPSPTGWWRAKCPLCVVRTGTPDKRGSLSIYVSEGYYVCHRCGLRSRFEPDDAVRTRYEQTSRPEGSAPMPIRPPEGFRPLAEEPAMSALTFLPARSYLAKRHVPVPLQQQLRIGACATGRFAGRVVVPILTREGEWLGYVGRAWRDHASFPYLYPAGMRKGEIIYNHDALLEETDEPVLVVEGVFDALALWPHSVAVLGKLVPRAQYVDDEDHCLWLSETQLDALAVAKRPVVVVPDGDAWEEGEMLSLRLRDEGLRSGFVRLPPRTDPDEVPLDWLHEEARKALG